MERSGGFTLVEALAWVALAATLLAVGAARLPPLVGSVRLAGATHELAAALRDARSHALARNRRVEVRFDPPRRSWSVSEESGALLATGRLPDGVVFAALPAALRVRFGTTGTADNATVALAGGAGRREVVVNQRGRVRIQ